MTNTLIVGAGVVGCACAFELAAAGADVRVIDPRPAGQGASQASAGMLAPFIEGHRADALEHLGRRSLDMYDAFVERVAAAADRRVEYARCGTLELALDTEHAERLRESVVTLRQRGVAARWLDAVEIRAAEPHVSADALGGRLIDGHGFVDVAGLTDALQAAALQSGARFECGSPVVSVGSDLTSGGELEVRTERGRWSASHVVIAAGSWSGLVRIDGADAPVDVRPVRGQLLHLSCRPPQPIRHVLWGPGCYIVPWSNGRVLVGATEEHVGFDERATAAGVRDLLEAGCALVPHLWQASFEAVRVGLRPASPDGLPIVGRSTVVPGLIYATGHYRNGVLLAPLTAMLVTQAILGDGTDPALDLLRPSRLGRL